MRAQGHDGEETATQGELSNLIHFVQKSAFSLDTSQVDSEGAGCQGPAQGGELALAPSRLQAIVYQENGRPGGALRRPSILIRQRRGLLRLAQCTLPPEGATPP